MREQPDIAGKRLWACLEEHYHLIPTSLDFLPLGLDYQAGVYQVTSKQGTSYLIKVKSGAFYEPGCLVPAYLSRQGITSVVAPVPANNHALWASVDGWTVMVYPFLEGETSWSGMTDEQWKETGATLQRIHQVTIPTSGFESLRKETFDPSGYAQWIRMFETQHLYEVGGASVSQHALRSSWIAYQSTIHAVMTCMEKLAERLKESNLPYVICHADLHPANLLRDSAGHVFVIDWDDVMLAPKERDFIFLKTSPSDNEILPGTLAFFQGYRQVDIDQIALAYYRYERVITDVIAFAESVCLREDLEEETRAGDVQLFQDVIAQAFRGLKC